MSAQPSSKARRAPIAIEAPGATVIKALSVRWGISRRALGEMAPPGSSALVHLSLQLRRDTVAVWTLIDPVSHSARIIPPLPEPDPISFRVVGDCVHVRCAQLEAFVRLDDPERPELLYARTPIFGALKIPGGRYQPMSVEVEAKG